MLWGQTPNDHPGCYSRVTRVFSGEPLPLSAAQGGNSRGGGHQRVPCLICTAGQLRHFLLRSHNGRAMAGRLLGIDASWRRPQLLWRITLMETGPRVRRKRGNRRTLEDRGDVAPRWVTSPRSCLLPRACRRGSGIVGRIRRRCWRVRREPAPARPAPARPVPRRGAPGRTAPRARGRYG
jgi:hypothetical protein